MTQTLLIAPRFCGPPGSGNGGYVCGRIAAYLGGSAQVTLRRPAPLATPLSVERDGQGSVRVLDGGILVAEGVELADDLTLGLPGPVSITAARAAGARCRLRVHPGQHPFPGCFVCGPDRPPADGLHILVGPVADRELSADVWYPDEALADPDGHLRPEFVWAALDCAGGIGALADIADGSPYLLGRMAACQLVPVTASQPHVVVGWRLAQDGRKVMAGSVLFTGSGQVAGVAHATWIRLDLPEAARPGRTDAGRQANLVS